MRLFNTTLFLVGCLLLNACCSTGDGLHSRRCESHPEPPFDISDGPPGTGLVFGTADFDNNGSVLLKLQIEDLSVIAGNEAAITAWSGNGEAPADASVVPPVGGSQVYASSGDVPLRHWTTHLDRNYDPTEDNYWVFVRVNHATSGGNRDVRYLKWEWPASAQSDLDTPHDFIQY